MTNFVHDTRENGQKPLNFIDHLPRSMMIIDTVLILTRFAQGDPTGTPWPTS